ncbi:MAG: NAD-binding protein [Actinobacteria bacterium]|nr:NAD-binding protein [Actinomycetota bacterium]
MPWQSLTSPKRILALTGVLLMIVIVGTAGFAILEGYGFLDSLFTTVVLISTVGMGTAPATVGGKLLAIFVIAGGVGTLVYAVGMVIEFLIGGYLAELLEERSMKKKISELSNHYLICGYGRVGEQVAKEFLRSGEEFVVVDSNPESIARAREDGFPHIEGDAADDESLHLAGIDRAKGLVACVDSDADNVFVTLSARVLSPSLWIVARGNTEESHNKLEKAGADKVVSPYAIGGREMATLMLKPMVSDYLDVVTGGGELELRVEQFQLSAGSPALGKSIRDLGIRQKTGASILAVKKPGQPFDTNPDPAILLEENVVLITVGTHAEIQLLEQLFAVNRVS